MSFLLACCGVGLPLRFVACDDAPPAAVAATALRGFTRLLRLMSRCCAFTSWVSDAKYASVCDTRYLRNGEDGKDNPTGKERQGLRHRKHA